MLSIIIPILNEQELIKCSIERLRRLSQYELIFVDGNSSDNSVRLLIQSNFKVLKHGHASRGAQLFYGAEYASNSILLFLHLDSKLPDDFDTKICHALHTKSWGRFDVRLKGDDWRLRIVEKLMNLRSRWTGIATGDQAIFVHKKTFFAYCTKIIEYPIMEDIFLCKRLKLIGQPACIDTPIVSSSRYWLKHGVFRAILKMWVLRLLYYFGLSPNYLYRLYYNK